MIKTYLFLELVSRPIFLWLFIYLKAVCTLTNSGGSSDFSDENVMGGKVFLAVLQWRHQLLRWQFIHKGWVVWTDKYDMGQVRLSLVHNIVSERSIHYNHLRYLCVHFFAFLCLTLVVFYFQCRFREKWTILSHTVCELCWSCADCLRQWCINRWVFFYFFYFYFS